MANLIKQYGTRFAKYATERVKVYDTPLISAPLVLYFPFDRNNRDYSMNGRNLTSFSGSYGVSPTKFNGAAFSPNALYVSPTDNDAGLPLKTTYNKSVSCSACGWFYYNSLPSGTTANTIFQIWGSRDSPVPGFLGQNQLKLLCFLQRDGFGTPRYVLQILGPPATQSFDVYVNTPSLNTWYFIYVEYVAQPINPNFSKWDLYIDNSLALSLNYGNNPPPDWGWLSPYLPRVGFGNIDGYVDDVAFFDRALTGTERSSIYNATRPIRILP
jgi:hypothetical protein